MLPEIRKCADQHDTKGLRYIFIDALDVDPTFEKYRDGYEYCRKLDGMFEEHQELSGLNPNKAEWNVDYWARLKVDMMKNFSEKRYVHMMQVAKVVYAEKIKRLVKERERALADAAAGTEKETRSGKMPPIRENVRTNVVIKEENFAAVSGNEMEERRIAEERRALEEDNRRIEAEQRAQRERIEAAQRAQREQIEAQRRGERRNARSRTEGNGSKKWQGIVFAFIVIAAAIFIVLVLR